MLRDPTLFVIGLIFLTFAAALGKHWLSFVARVAFAVNLFWFMSGSELIPAVAAVFLLVILLPIASYSRIGRFPFLAYFVCGVVS